MKFTFPVTKEMVCARSTLPISQKSAKIVCRALNRKKYSDAKNIIQNLVDEKIGLGYRKGKYYTKTAKEILKLLKSLEANAQAKNKDADNMFLYISAHKGPTLYRSRRKWRFGREMKICHVQAVLKGGK